VPDHDIYFLELDQVTVKGKTTTQRIYWPVVDIDKNEKLRKDITAFELGLELYYQGKWADARKRFLKCGLKAADVFKERTKEKCPSNWKGVWEMTSK
jgi:hypothetical protein